MPSPGTSAPPRPTLLDPPGSSFKLSMSSLKWNTYRGGSDANTAGGSSTPFGKDSTSVSAFSLNPESACRRERRLLEREREDRAIERENAGKKRFYVHVNEDGKPYGLGIGTWNDMLGKVVRGLDPSYIDIRHQPFHLMETLCERLNEHFEYSDKVNPAWLRARVGAALSSYRHDLIKRIEYEGNRPHWVSESIWEKLVTMAGSDKFKAKSEQMRKANASRRTKGRTGPIGIVGIQERLRMRLGKTPDPEEVESEMRRDKGYGGKSRQRKFNSSRDSDSYGIGGQDAVGRLSSNNQKSPELEEALSPIREARHRTPHQIPSPDVSLPGNDSVSHVVTECEDITFAKSHPLGRVILRQMQELKTTPECNTPELQMVLDGLMTQIRALRSKSNSYTQLQSGTFHAQSSSLPDLAANAYVHSSTYDKPENSVAHTEVSSEPNHSFSLMSFTILESREIIFSISTLFISFLIMMLN